MTYFAEQMLGEHSNRMRDLRSKTNFDKPVYKTEVEYISVVNEAIRSLAPYTPYEEPEPETEWFDVVQDPEERDLFISPTDVLVKVLHRAFTPWYVKSVQYTVDPQMQSLSVDVRFGGTLLYILMVCCPLLILILPLALKRHLEKCDLMSDVTSLQKLEVDVFWSSPGYTRLEDIRSQEEILELTMAEDRRLIDSYLDRSLAQLPFEITEEEEVSLYV